MRIIRFIAGILLLPVCVAVTRTLFGLLRSVEPHSAALLPPALWALMIGFALWVFLYMTLPRPVRSHIVAHEFTHALWGWLMGARVHRIRLGRTGGSVALSKTNVMITLAPYFFPFYSVLVVGGYLIGSLFLNLRPYYLYWVGLLGLTWASHLTFTLSSLRQRQTDIEQYGRLFSYTVIYLLNAVVGALLLVLITEATIGRFAALLWRDIPAVWIWCYRRLTALAAHWMQ